MNRATLELIKRFEGLDLKPYRCPAGVLSIGYGHVILSHEADLMGGISEEEATRLLERDARAAEAAVLELVRVPLNANQVSALTSFVFNLGRGNFRRSTLLRRLNDNDHHGAADEFDRWVMAGGRRQPGLVKRRTAERALFLRPVLCKLGT